MLARHALSAPGGRGWKPWLLGPALALAAGSWDGGQALAYPATPAPANTTYRILPLWEAYPIAQPGIDAKDQVAFAVPGPGGVGARAKFFDGRRVHDIGTLGGANRWRLASTTWGKSSAIPWRRRLRLDAGNGHPLPRRLRGRAQCGAVRGE